LIGWRGWPGALMEAAPRQKLIDQKERRWLGAKGRQWAQCGGELAAS